MSILSKSVSLFILLFIIVIAVSEYSSPAYSNTSGAPATRTGSPGDAANCAICHSGTASTQAGLISSDIPVTGYVPGNTYTIMGSITSAGKTKFGFEISPQNLAGVLKGMLVLTNTTTTQLVGGSKYVTHKTAGTSFPTGTATWSFNWVAPIAGTGDLTFYGAFNITNSSGTSSGDIIKLSTLFVQENLFAGINDLSANKESCTVYPNPAHEKLFFMNENNLKIISVSIVDITGKFIKTINGDELFKNESFDISFLKNGIYLINIFSEKGTITKKLIKN